jgi:hypothetical protein
MMTLLAGRVAARVQAAVVRAWANGLCTARRFQGHAACMWGCRRGEDSVEHYSRCGLTATAAGEAFGLKGVSGDCVRSRAEDFLLLCPGPQDVPMALAQKALRVAPVGGDDRNSNGKLYPCVAAQRLSDRRHSVSDVRNCWHGFFNLLLDTIVLSTDLFVSLHLFVFPLVTHLASLFCSWILVSVVVPRAALCAVEGFVRA